MTVEFDRELTKAESLFQNLKPLFENLEHHYM